jgi:hypothetical protein
MNVRDFCGEKCENYALRRFECKTPHCVGLSSKTPH